MPKVSVIVPVYNVEKYLPTCVESLVNQTLEDIEIILVSDASPDGSNKIMADYEKKYSHKVKCMYLKENIKQGGARNRGLEIATGEYVTFVDSDDYVDVTMLEKMYKEAIEQKCDMVYSDYYNNYLNENRLGYMSFVSDQIVGELNEEKRKMLFFTLVPPYAKLIKTSLIRDNKLYFPEKMYYEDTATTLLYHMYAKKIGWVQEPLYYYSIREDSTAQRTNSSHQLDESKAGLILHEQLMKRGFYTQYQDEIDMLFLIYFYMHPLQKAIEKFQDLPLDYMKYLRDTVQERYPNYRDNKYYYLVEDAYLYDYITINDESPEKLKKMIESGEYTKKNASYENYYIKVKKEVITLFKTCEEKGYRIGIWGAGKKGRDFLRVCDPKQQYVKMVFDNNEKLNGVHTETGHSIYKYSENYDKIDVVFVMNRNYYQAIKKEIEKHNPEVRIVNLELWIQFDYDLRIQ